MATHEGFSNRLNRAENGDDKFGVIFEAFYEQFFRASCLRTELNETINKSEEALVNVRAFIGALVLCWSAVSADSVLFINIHLLT